MKTSVLLLTLALSCPALRAQEVNETPAKTAAETTPVTIPGRETFVYRDGQPDPMRLHVFKPKGWKAGDKLPALVWFFGGDGPRVHRSVPLTGRAMLRSGAWSASPRITARKTASIRRRWSPSPIPARPCVGCRTTPRNSALIRPELWWVGVRRVATWRSGPASKRPLPVPTPTRHPKASRSR